MSAVKINNTGLLVTELNNYLKSHNYFETEETEATDERIKSEWAGKFEESITKDIKSRFDNIEIDFISSEFELISEDCHGACVFFHRATIADTRTKELIKIIIKTIVNHPRTEVYLTGEYANTLKWHPDSKTLKTIFKKLKQADKKPGYFLPIYLEELLKKKSVFNIFNDVRPL